jgi:hypothetical protein
MIEAVELGGGVAGADCCEPQSGSAREHVSSNSSCFETSSGRIDCFFIRSPLQNLSGHQALDH